MRRTASGLVGLTLAVALVTAGGGPAAAGSPASGTPTPPPDRQGPLLAPPAARSDHHKVDDDLPDAEESERRALRRRALDLVLTGQRKVERVNGSDVVRVGTKQAPYTRAELSRLRSGRAVRPRWIDSYVELSRDRTDKVFVVLAEFGDERDPRYPDRDTDPQTPGPATFEGPRHNTIPRPDRAVDNTTIWQADYDPEHYRRLYFGEGPGVESLKTYYEKQSSGRYSVEGTVTDWVKVRYNAARYGRSDDAPDDAGGDDPYVCSATICPNTWDLVRDALNQWVADQRAAGRTDEQIRTDVAEFDQQDRNDHDGDGDFSEPDGYVDHFQIVHAGGDQADGDPQQGEDAIWSHRWKAYPSSGGGPTANRDGGTEVGDTGIWVADYTMQPENGGLSVFAHEFGHDLGLPDHYDTATGADNGVEWWTLMAQSRVRGRGDEGLGTRPADLGAWDKLQLGWLDYEVATAGERRSFRLGPHEYNTPRPQALAVVLPPRQEHTPLPAPSSGQRQWWSGQGHDLDRTLTRTVTLGEAPVDLRFSATWDIEDCGPDPCDYAFVQVNEGTGWSTLAGTITQHDEGNNIDGTSAGAVPAHFDLSAYAGKTVQLRFRYATDGTDAGLGFFVDDITVTSAGQTVFADGAEDGLAGWTADGFTRVGDTFTTSYPRYYLASYRTYSSFDRYLRTGPYNFGFGSGTPRRAEFFPYQRGLLVSYWDESHADNNTSAHDGGGLVLPIDAHPDPLRSPDGTPYRGRIQVYDAPFSLRRSDPLTLHVDGRRQVVPGRPAQPLFDDTRSYRDPAVPGVGVQTPRVGVTLRIVRQSDTGMTVRLGTSRPLSPAAILRQARATDPPPGLVTQPVVRPSTSAGG